ncbi:uncharacterized protein [Panulirus ornatus]|uniref:uncharacterized protein n=1 Tax=Panulirus ornatus TaxID=150431 RepID=UPI003A861F7D
MLSCHAGSLFQIIEVEEAIERVLAGGFSYISFKSTFLKDMEDLYDEMKGDTPLHLGSTEYIVLGGNSWGARRGAPFTGQIVRMKQRMLEAGLITHWMDDLVRMRVVMADKSRAGSTVSSESHMVLGLDHLQGAFYLLLLGYIIAFFSFLGENLAHCCPVLLHRQ